MRRPTLFLCRRWLYKRLCRSCISLPSTSELGLPYGRVRTNLHRNLWWQAWCLNMSICRDSSRNRILFSGIPISSVQLHCLRPPDAHGQTAVHHHEASTKARPARNADFGSSGQPKSPPRCRIHRRQSRHTDGANARRGHETRHGTDEYQKNGNRVVHPIFPRRE